MLWIKRSLGMIAAGLGHFSVVLSESSYLLGPISLVFEWPISTLVEKHICTKYVFA